VIFSFFGDINNLKFKSPISVKRFQQR